MNNWLLRNGRLSSQPEPVDVLIRDGKILAISPELNRFGKESELDLGGRLVIPGFVDCHMHLDKAYALESGLEAGDSLDSAVQSFFQWADTITQDQLYHNARRAIEQSLLHGTIALRTHVSVDAKIGTSWLEPLAQVKREMKPFITVQIVAFLDSSLFNGENSVLDISKRAIAAGADLIGGAPSKSADPCKLVDTLFDVAGKIGCDLDLHVDESDNPADNSLEYLAEQALARGFRRNIAAGHCCSLSAMDEMSAERIIKKVAQAGINIITLPSCNLFLMGRNDRGLVRRGLTRVRQLLSSGVNVAYASDNIRDAFNPYGKADMLQGALITAHAIQIGSTADFDILLAMGTHNPARIMDLKNYGLEPGCWASLVVLDDTEWSSAVAREAARSYVFSRGHLIAQTEVKQNLLMEI